MSNPIVFPTSAPEWKRLDCSIIECRMHGIWMRPDDADPEEQPVNEMQIHARLDNKDTVYQLAMYVDAPNGVFQTGPKRVVKLEATEFDDAVMEVVGLGAIENGGSERLYSAYVNYESTVELELPARSEKEAVSLAYMMAKNGDSALFEGKELDRDFLPESAFVA